MPGKKGRQSSRNKARGKYAAQKIRTTMNKAKAYRDHLEKHPDDKKNKKIFIDKGVSK